MNAWQAYSRATHDAVRSFTVNPSYGQSNFTHSHKLVVTKKFQYAGKQYNILISERVCKIIYGLAEFSHQFKSFSRCFKGGTEE